MSDFSNPKEEKYQDLLELHQQLIGLEKIEIKSERLNYTTEQTVEDYKDFFAYCKDHIALIQEGQIKHVSPCLAGLVGYPEKYLIGDYFAAHVLPDEIPKVFQIYKDRLAEKNAPIVYSTIIRHKTGKSILIKIIASKTNYLGKPANFAIIKEEVLNQEGE
jgi:PAS domain S-box-containing protein